MMIANVGAGIVLIANNSSANHTNAVINSSDKHLSIIDADHMLTIIDDGGDIQAPESVNPVISMIPVISCILITFGYACGLGPVPFILFGELFPGNIKSCFSVFG